MLGVTTVSIALMLIALTAAVSAYSPTYVETYVLGADGNASLTVVINGVAGLDNINISLEKGYDPNSVYAFTPEGTPLYVRVADTTATIELLNLSNQVLLTYTARLGNVTNGIIVEYSIHPIARAVVYLPKDAALMGATGNPNVSLSNNTIVLIYDKPGTYTITFSIVPPEIKTTTTVTQVPTTSATTSSQTSTTQQTISQPTATESSSLATSSMTTPSTSITTSAQTTTQYTKPGTSYWEWVIITIIIIAVVAGVGAYLSRSRGGNSEDLSLTAGLDERDVAILKALSAGEKSVSELSRDLNLNKSVVWRRVKRLKDLGLLSMRVEKGKTLYSLTDSGMEALRSHGNPSNEG